jgi:hypothetical protein
MSVLVVDMLSVFRANSIVIVRLSPTIVIVCLSLLRMNTLSIPVISIINLVAYSHSDCEDYRHHINAYHNRAPLLDIA